MNSLSFEDRCLGRYGPMTKAEGAALDTYYGQLRKAQRQAVASLIRDLRRLDRRFARAYVAQLKLVGLL